MRFYYPEMVKAIDLKKEDARLAQVEFTKEAPVKVGENGRRLRAPRIDRIREDPG